MCNRYVTPEQAETERFWLIGRHNQLRWASEVFRRALGRRPASAFSVVLPILAAVP